MPHSSSQIFLRELDKKLWTATDNLPVHTGGLKESGRLAHPYKITSTGKLIDDALEAVEKENPKLKNVLNKDHVRLQIQQENLAGLAPAKPSGDAGLIDTIPFQHATCPGIVKRRRTPKSIVSLIVEMIEPYQGRVYDPAMGSGGFFVQSERFIEEHGGTIGDIMVFGQDQWAWGAHLRRAKCARRVRLRRKHPNQSNPTTWRLAAMNMAESLPRQSETATGGIDFDFGKEPADTFTRDQHPDLRADFVMALPSAAARSLPRSHSADRPSGRINPPFNIKEWWDGKLEGDARWKYGTPPQGNANFAWVQHMLHHLAPNGSMALLLANGSMSSNSSGEGDIRRALIEADLVECMVALPDLLAVDPIKVTIAHKARIMSHSPSRKEIINAN